MDQGSIKGVELVELKKIEQDNGAVLHAMKQSSPAYFGFGEAYFSTIIQGEIKGWRKHHRMNSNLVVPHGEVEFVIYDDRENSESYQKFQSVKLSRNSNYQRLYVPPGVWVANRGVAQGESIVLNMADIEHDPEESSKCPLNEISYDWSQA